MANSTVDTKILCGFRNFVLTGDNDFNLDPIWFSSDYGFMEKEFSDEDFLNAIGSIRAHNLIGDSSFGYNISKFVNRSENDDATEFKTFATMVFTHVNAFFSFLWFLKDTSAHQNEMIAFNPFRGGQIVLMPNHETFSCADGGNKTSEYSHEDLQKVYAIISKFNEIHPNTSTLRETDFAITKSNTLPPRGNLRPYNESSRIERALIFLTFARRAVVLPMKIAMYMPIFESLFSSENAEISHKVAERCAYYLGGDRAEKIKNYDTIKKAYDLRSKLLHGATLTEHNKPEKNHNRIETQQEISVEIDRLTRIVLTKVIMEDSEKFLAKDMSSFYKELIFT